MYVGVVICCLSSIHLKAQFTTVIQVCTYDFCPSKGIQLSAKILHFHGLSNIEKNIVLFYSFKVCRDFPQTIQNKRQNQLTGSLN